ncbi:DUF3467 domain-containing protein [Candidatus Microgenomates bacterium]|nr:DUF3467 domain-containing protein [Candidatus Microgenomates bacterium]
MIKKPKKTKPVVNISIPDNLRAGAHANVVSLTTTSDDEAIFDFIFIHPQEKEAGISRGVLVSRVVLSKPVAKRLLKILKKHLSKTS